MKLSFPYLKYTLLATLILCLQTKAFAYEKEDKVLCALTSKVAKFTRSNHSELSPYTITFFNSKFGDLCADMYRNTTINDKPVEVQQVSSVEDLQPTNILFIANASVDELKQIFSYTQGKPILTMGAIRGFAHRGGMVNFYDQNQKIKIQVNIKSLEREKISIHSALLRFATIIHGESND